MYLRNIAMKSIFVLAALLCLNVGAMAEETGPDQLIKNITTEVLDIVRKDKDIRAGSHKKAIDLIETKVLPHFDFSHMTRLALARDWRQATPAQQAALIEEFRLLLVRTYSKALTEYKNQTVDFKPFKMQAGETDVKVRTQIEQSGTKAIGLDYYLDKQAAGWKVYDIEVAGISLITNYRESFSNEIRQGGIDGLIKTLQAKNKSGETVAAKKAS
jgi:phospholipid transport system substrate-binding protein